MSRNDPHPSPVLPISSNREKASAFRALAKRFDRADKLVRRAALLSARAKNAEISAEIEASDVVSRVTRSKY